MWWVLITWFTSVFNCVELLLDCVVFFNWPNVFARGTWNWAPCAGKQPPMFPPSATDECDDWWVCTQGDLLGTNTLLVVEWRGPKDLCTVATPRIISEQYTSVVFCAEIILNYSHFRISLTIFALKLWTPGPSGHLHLLLHQEVAPETLKTALES
jgi:hypothetical protein